MSIDVKKINWREQFDKDLNIYEFSKILPGTGEEIKFKPLTTKLIKKLLVYENSKDQDVIENALDELIMSTITSPATFNILDVYMQDRFSLLLEIRKKSKGETYQFTLECPECKSQSLQTINLNDLEEKKLNPNYNKEIKLTENITIGLDYITRREHKEGLNYIKKIKSNSETEKLFNSAMVMLCFGIEYIKVNDEKDDSITIEDKLHLIENIPTSILEKIKNWSNENNFGVNMSFSRKCPNCKHEEIIEVPLTDFF